MILLDGKLVPGTPPELLWVPEVSIQVYDPWCSLWLDVASVNYISGTFVINFKSVNPPLEIPNMALVEARVKNADDKSSS
jgi:hypothetical protein